MRCSNCGHGFFVFCLSWISVCLIFRTLKIMLHTFHLCVVLSGARAMLLHYSIVVRSQKSLDPYEKDGMSCFLSLALIFYSLGLCNISPPPCVNSKLIPNLLILSGARLVGLGICVCFTLEFSVGRQRAPIHACFESQPVAEALFLIYSSEIPPLVFFTARDLKVKPSHHMRENFILWLTESLA